mmetsp:Transcript_68813/g.157923  ORF Transcript_68813/g.157923 Transcript_68813/m.157923 type:complete len:390 (-) Transcript_68813:1010-2179(-)
MRHCQRIEQQFVIPLASEEADLELESKFHCLMGLMKSRHKHVAMLPAEIPISLPQHLLNTGGKKGPSLGGLVRAEGGDQQGVLVDADDSQGHGSELVGGVVHKQRALDGRRGVPVCGHGLRAGKGLPVLGSPHQVGRYDLENSAILAYEVKNPLVHQPRRLPAPVVAELETGRGKGIRVHDHLPPAREVGYATRSIVGVTAVHGLLGDVIKKRAQGPGGHTHPDAETPEKQGPTGVAYLLVLQGRWPLHLKKQLALDLQRPAQGVLRLVKSQHKSVPLRSDFVPVMGVAAGAQQLIVQRDGSRHRCREHLPLLGRPLHVCEDDGAGAGGGLALLALGLPVNTGLRETLDLHPDGPGLRKPPKPIGNLTAIHCTSPGKLSSNPSIDPKFL